MVDVADDAAAALRICSARYGADRAGLTHGAKCGPRATSPPRSDGPGLVVIHAANNAFTGWTDYEKMVGVLWREGSGHGKFHEFAVAYVAPDHPVTSGLGDMAAHPDELYHKLANTRSTPFTLLAKAMSSTESGGTGNEEPMALAVQFGKGRVFHTPLGHVWENVQATKPSISDPQFRLLLSRGAEWAATGAVTLSASGRPARTNAYARGDLTDGSCSSTMPR